MGGVVCACLGCSENRPERAAETGGASKVSRETPKEEFLRIADRLENSMNPFLGRLQVDPLRRRLRSSDLPAQEALNLRYNLGRHLLRLGRTEEAIEQLERASALIGSSLPFQGRVPPELHFVRALAYLRQAEVTNCIEHHNAECCIFPLQGGGIHSRSGPGREARRSLLAFLDSKPENLEALWLLNVISMALDGHTEGVPENYRIPRTAFESDYEIGRFVDVAPALGLDTFNLCGGAIVEDFNGDELLDIITSTYDPRGPLTHYRNLGDGRFDDVSSASRLDEQFGGLNCLAADYDNDGDMDVLVLRGAWLFDAGKIRNSLLRNESDGAFTDVTHEAGLATPAMPTQAAVWGDFDNDGDLDLYIGNESRMEFPAGDGHFPSQLFRNEGDGTFTDIASEAGVTNDRYCKGVAAGDYDNDGDFDLYVSNQGKNRLYRNNGNGTFTDVAQELGVTEPEGRSFATWFFDYDNDGWLDLFVAAYQASIGDIAADYLGLEHSGVAPRLYHNVEGRFVDVTREAGLDHPYLPMGANFGDLDYDGYLDIYLATGDPDYWTLTPNVMLRNDAGKRFQDVTTSGGLGHLQKGHGVAFADIDNDGDQDVYNQLGGFYPGDRFHNALFLNPGHGGRWLIIKLLGMETNRSAIGARIRVVVQTPSGRRIIHRALGSVSSFGGSPIRQEIGLGEAISIEKAEITWPTSKTIQTITGIPLDAMIRVTEGKDGFEVVTLKPLTLYR